MIMEILSKDILIQILCFIKPYDLFSLRLISKQFKTLIESFDFKFRYLGDVINFIYVSNSVSDLKSHFFGKRMNLTLSYEYAYFTNFYVEQKTDIQTNLDLYHEILNNNQYCVYNHHLFVCVESKTMIYSLKVNQFIEYYCSYEGNITHIVKTKRLERILYKIQKGNIGFQIVDLNRKLDDKLFKILQSSIFVDKLKNEIYFVDSRGFLFQLVIKNLIKIDSISLSFCENSGTSLEIYGEFVQKKIKEI